MIIKKCEHCEKEYECISLRPSKRKYCSEKCANGAHYLRHKDKYKENAKRWTQKNPERAREIQKKSFKKFREEKREVHNDLMKKNYRRNKDKHDSRTRTYRILEENAGYKKYNPLSKKCARCGSIDNLEVHHEVYPLDVESIMKAIDLGQIYYLCLNHHGRRGTHNVTTNK